MHSHNCSLKEVGDQIMREGSIQQKIFSRSGADILELPEALDGRSQFAADLLSGGGQMARRTSQSPRFRGRRHITTCLALRCVRSDIYYLAPCS